jgi:hypothetical protein
MISLCCVCVCVRARVLENLNVFFPLSPFLTVFPPVSSHNSTFPGIVHLYLEYGAVEYSCEQGNEPYNSVKGGSF